MNNVVRRTFATASTITPQPAPPNKPNPFADKLASGPSFDDFVSGDAFEADDGPAKVVLGNAKG